MLLLARAVEDGIRSHFCFVVVTGCGHARTEPIVAGVDVESLVLGLLFMRSRHDGGLALGIGRCAG